MTAYEKVREPHTASTFEGTTYCHGCPPEQNDWPCQTLQVIDELKKASDTLSSLVVEIDRIGEEMFTPSLLARHLRFVKSVLYVVLVGFLLLPALLRGEIGHGAMYFYLAATLCISLVIHGFRIGFAIVEDSTDFRHECRGRCVICEVQL